MTLSDEAKLFAVRQKLLAAERTLYEANKIIAYIGDQPAPVTFELGHNTVDNSMDSSDSYDVVTGLYPGQIPNQVSTEEGAC